MKKTKMLLSMAAMLTVIMVVFTACDFGDEEPEKQQGPESVKLDFLENDFGGVLYDPGDALTDAYASLNYKAEKAGDDGTLPACLKLSGNLQKDKYGDAKEIGVRLKVAEYLGVDSVSLLNKVIAVKAYVATGAVNTALQLSLQSENNQQAMGEAQDLTPGDWTTVYYKLIDSTDADFDATVSQTDKQYEFISCDSEGTWIKKGAYSSNTFDSDHITQFDIRSVGGTTANINDAVTVWFEFIEW
jgi:hypothetical protein